MALWVQTDVGNSPEASPAVQALLAESRQRRRRGFNRREWRAEFLVGGGFLLASAALLLAVPSERPVDPAVLGLVLVCMTLASRVRFEVASCYTMPTQLVLIPALFLLPPQIVPLVVALGLAAGKSVELWRGSAPFEGAFLAFGDSWFALGPAVVLIAAGSPHPIGGAWVLIPALLAQFLGESSATAVREHLHGGAGWREQLAEALWIYRVDALLTPIGLALAIAADQEPAALALVLPLLALLLIFARERSERIDYLFELSEAYRGTARVLAQVVEHDDAYTGMHTRGVVELSIEVAAEMKLGSTERRNIEFAGLVHDVGKIAIPKAILNKPVGLDAREWALMRTHTLEGQQMLEQIGGVMSDVGRIVRSAHEHFDGSGYPDGLRGEEIPVEARVVFCCDAFNAMTTDRPYRNARSPEAAVAELRAHAGSQFDPRVVAALVEVLGPDLAGAAVGFAKTERADRPGRAGARGLASVISR
ncbi:MAG TPA: HD-GYP domain-containing protein [Solirubrobacterales bacterium]|nr:HD-GYP domain-containing protein [Solirubrobacterales bacterium]